MLESPLFWFIILMLIALDFQKKASKRQQTLEEIRDKHDT